jgi:2'-5' RNA ligase
MRLFLAIKPEGLFLKALDMVSGGLKAILRNAAFAPLQNMHITLCFIGETDKAEIIKAAGISFNPFEVGLGRLGIFGGRNSALVWIGLESGGALEAAAADIRLKLRDNGVNFDSKPFKPHITIARKAHVPDGISLSSIKIPKVAMICDRIELFKSEHTNGKRLYTSIAAF